MSQVSRGDLSFLDPSVDHLIDLVEALAQFGVVQNFDRKDWARPGRKIRLYVRVQNRAVRQPSLVTW